MKALGALGAALRFGVCGRKIVLGKVGGARHNASPGGAAIPTMAPSGAGTRDGRKVKARSDDYGLVKGF